METNGCECLERVCWVVRGCFADWSLEDVEFEVEVVVGVGSAKDVRMLLERRIDFG